MSLSGIRRRRDRTYPTNPFALRESALVSHYYMEMSLYIMIQLITETHLSLLHMTVPSHVRQKYPTV